MSDEITNIGLKEFTTEKNGYSQTEVKNYIKVLEEKFTQQEKIQAELKSQLEEIEKEISEYKSIEKELRESVSFFKDLEKETIRKTKDKISAMIQEAEDKSQNIIDLAEEEAKSTRDTLLFLKEQREILLVRLKIIIDSQEGMLNDFISGKVSDELQKSLAEVAAFKAQNEIKIDSILEKLL
ncbi:MAG: DivIVA domain-containing protein [Ignavibacteriae bacterium]|nr:DivIVA domain-containing protein [Ignavibacteriota bacterium]MCB9206238.1 DivIVA domain-containing protein [Ignavibacteriales bacterium]MCB9260334.1 DivIVA domain-containing protein [Ignavibacteriales bacterium]